MKKILIAATFGFFLLISGAQTALAGTEHNMSGYAWSSGIGWISFNCTNHGSCATSNFGVNMDASGFLSGYAWSSSVGWIQFGGLSGFPTGGGTQSTDARISGSTGIGWARALAHGDGWDGWISLGGTGYGVSYNAGIFSGYAWGGDVIGWVLFDVQQVYPAICSDCGVKIANPSSLDFDVRTGGANGASINGSSNVAYNTVPTFVWTLTNMPSATCSLSKTSANGTSFTTVSGITASGNTSGPALTGPFSYAFELSCSSPSITKTVSFSVAQEPEGFSLGSDENLKIQFLESGSADSETKAVFVTGTTGGFSGNVSVDVDPSASTCPGATYSLGGAEFLANPAPVVLSSPYQVGAAFKVRLANPVAGPCDVGIVGTSQGMTATKKFIVSPQDISPAYQEI